MLCLAPSAPAAEAGPGLVRGLREKQAMRTHQLEITRPAGLAYSGDADLFIVIPALDGSAGSAKPGAAALMTKFGEAAGSIALPIALSNPRAVAYDGHGHRLLVLDVATRSLYAIPGDAAGGFDATRTTRLEAPRVGLLKPIGMTVDPASGEVFVLDHLTRGILRFTPEAASGGRGEDAAIPSATWVGLGPLALLELDGIAFDPVRRHLFTLEAAGRVLHELADDGRQVASYDVSAVALGDPQSMVFAPSGDQTDDPSTLSLFIADPGTSTSPQGHVLEAAWTTDEVSVTEATSVSATLVRVTATSAFNPPSPDPSGITYDSVRGRLVIDDGEVDEMSIYKGKEVFETSLTGGLLRTFSVLSFTDEPVGAAFNANNRHLFISDDDHDKVFDINPGGDGLVGTSDDTHTTLSTSAFGSGDPEGIAYDRINNRIFIGDGVNEEIYVWRPGTNGVFDGVSPAGDDQVTHFDTHVLNVTDPETVEYKEDTGTLLLLGSTGSQVVKEVTTTGSLVSQIDLSFAPLSKPAGMAYAPTSNNPAAKSLYIVNRAVDNNSNPNENDGTLVEIGLGGSSTSNTAPVVSAGLDQTVALSAGAALDGTVSDDGLPNPPGAVTTTWSVASGPGPVGFQNANAVDTQASFTTAGTYVLSLMGNDGALSTTDQVQVTVQSTPPPGGTLVERRIAGGSDDAEEAATGGVDISSSDLELVYDGSNQRVGLRFTNVAIARGATISTAYIQFEADEAQNEVTNLTLQGQSADNAATFATTTGDVSARPLTTASVSWAPPAWNTVGEVGSPQRTPELKTVIQQIVGRAGWASGNALAIIITGTGHRTARSYNGRAAGAALLHIEVATTNTASVVNAGPDQTIALPAAAALDGTVSDDGLPNPPGALTTTWSVASGPGPVSFQNANAVDTQASFTTAGTYLLNLTANDGALSSSDQVQVTVQPASSNTAPVVNAGPDQTITLPAAAALDGTVSDDGLPNPPGAVTTTWSVASGPGPVSFQNANAIDTQASFTTAGTYVLRLTANDGALSTNDQVQVTVLAATNAAPVVNAGLDQAIALPAAALLDGTVSDDGLPNPPGAVTTTWSVASGPGPVSFQNANAIDTQASFTTAGTYLLALTGNDGALSTTDQVRIIVDPTGALDRRIAAGPDDAEELATGHVSLNSNDLELVYDKSNQIVGLRFALLSIPPGATITTATIQFKADEAQSEVTSLLIQGQAAGNAGTFVNSGTNVSSRPRTAASVSWSPAAWNTVGEADSPQRTPDFKTVIQEIVNRSDYTVGSALVIIITGTGHRTAEAFEGQASGAALLHVQYQ